MGSRRMIAQTRASHSDSRFLGAENNRKFVGLRIFAGRATLAQPRALPIKPRWNMRSLVQSQPAGPGSFFDIHIALGLRIFVGSYV